MEKKKKVFFIPYFLLGLNKWPISQKLWITRSYILSKYVKKKKQVLREFKEIKFHIILSYLFSLEVISVSSII